LTNKRTCSFITDVRHDDMNVEAFCDAWKALKSVFGPGSALDPAEGAHDVPQTAVTTFSCLLF